MSHGPCDRGGAAAAGEVIINVTPASVSAPAIIRTQSIPVFMFILFLLPCQVYPGTGVLPFYGFFPGRSCNFRREGDVRVGRAHFFRVIPCSWGDRKSTRLNSSHL